MAEKAPKESYEHILERARRMNLDSMKQLGVLSLPELRAADGRPVVVMTPGLVELPRFQDADFVDRLKCHMLLSLDGISKQEYTVVLFATKMKFSLKVFKFLFSEVYSILPRPYKKNIKALYVVHMPDAVKFFQRVVLFMISHKFWKKVRYLCSRFYLLFCLASCLLQPEAYVRPSTRFTPQQPGCLLVCPYSLFCPPANPVLRGIDDGERS